MSTIKVHIKSSGDKKYEVSVDTSSSIEDLKVIISAEADVPPERQRLIYSGKVLKDSETVASYKIQDGHTIHLVKSAAPKTDGAAASSASTTTSSERPATASSGTSGSVPSNIAAGQGSFNPLADLTGARYAGYTQLPSASMFGPDGGMGAFPDADQVNLMMSSPMFQEQMNALLLNPQMLDFVINQNPQLRAMGPQVRAMLQSPMFRDMLLNPETMRSMMQMSRAQAGGAATDAFPAPGLNPTLGGDSAGGADASADSTGTGSGAGTGNPAANPFASLFPNGMPPMDPFAMFGGAGAAGAGGAAAQQDDRPPEVRYESQLGQLNDMGFFDFEQNVAALRRSGGNVQGAVEFLLSGNF
ncbi:CIC11C00000002210 [Sungouiella intermedia]|uniref:CIC11C00000002210 n=1 Tax=Sungouiella intermedia TaxID=45354 RepID=A0A1L0BG24_9ASCO|nr:CIC11C00000002210 [[Candida] intermedia]